MNRTFPKTKKLSTLSEEHKSVSQMHTYNFNKDEEYLTKDTLVNENGDIIDPNDISYESCDDPVPVIIFDSELNFLEKINKVEIVFLLDTTGSMNPYFKYVKRFIRKLIQDCKKTISKYENSNLDLIKFGLVGYKDHCTFMKDQPIKESEVLCNLTEDLNKFKYALYNTEIIGGEDECEAVLHGIKTSVSEINWSDDSYKFLYHICDAPAHGANFNKIKQDYYPKGCPCGIQAKDVLMELRGKGIEYTVIMLEEGMETMLEAFSKYTKIDVMTPNIKKEEGVLDLQKINYRLNE